jgi:hypothetical protein
MPGPVYTSGRSALTSSPISVSGGLIQGPPSSKPYTVTFPSKIYKGQLAPAIPPTFPAAADLASGTGTRAFSAVSTQAGDYILVESSTDNNSVTFSDLSASIPGLTIISLSDSGTSGASDKSRAFQWVFFDATGASRTATMTPADVSLQYRARVTVIRGSGGIGAKNVAQNAQVAAINRQGNNSAVFMTVGDWTSADLSAATWTPGGSTTSTESIPGTASYAFGRWNDSGTATLVSTNHGMNTPVITGGGVAVIEFLGLVQTIIPVSNGAAAFTSDASMVVAGTVTELGSSAFTDDTSLVVAGSVTVQGSTGLSSDTSMIVAGTVTKFGANALNADTSLSVIGTRGVSAVSAFTIQVTQTSAAIITRLGASAFTIQANQSTAGSVIVLAGSAFTIQVTESAGAVLTRFGASALTVQAIETAAAIVTRFGIASLTDDVSLSASAYRGQFVSPALTVQVGLSATGTVTSLSGANADLTIQATMTVAAVISTTGTTALTIQGNQSVTGIVTVLAGSSFTEAAVLTSNSLVTKLANSAFTVQSVLSALGFGLVPSGSIAFNSQSTLTATGSIGALPAGAALTSQSVLTVTAFATETPVIGLTANTNLAANGFASTTGNSALSIQTTLIAAGTIGALPAGANFSALSSITVTGKATQVPIIRLSADSSISVTGRITQFGILTFNANAVINATGVVARLGAATFTIQSGLLASGYIALIYFGSAAFSAMSDLDVDGHAEPPWTLTLIELSSVNVVSYSGGSAKTNTKEANSSVYSIEGG